MRADAGSATIAAVGIILVVVTLLLSLVIVGGVVVATHRARAAADLAALAAAAELDPASRGPATGVTGAGQLSDAGSPCARASAVAQANGGTLLECVAGPGALVVDVEVSAPLPRPVAMLGPARSRARAGSAPSAGP